MGERFKYQLKANTEEGKLNIVKEYPLGNSEVLLYNILWDNEIKLINKADSGELGEFGSLEFELTIKGVRK